MQRLVWLGRFTLAALVAFCLVRDLSAAPDAQFRNAKRIFQQKMRSRMPLDRSAAVRTLKSFEVPEAAELIAKLGLMDESDEVVKASCEVLISFKESTDQGLAIVDYLATISKKEGMPRSVPRALWVLSHFEQPELEKAITKYLDDLLASPKTDLQAVFSMIDDLGTEGDKQSVQTLKLLTRTQVFTSRFGYRRAIVQAMRQIPLPDAIEFLIMLLPKSKGLVQHDVVQHLTNVTKQKFRDDDRKWRAWWDQNKATFKHPPLDSIDQDEDIDEGALTYYEIPICAKRIVFVLDTSGSMAGQRLYAAKQALVGVVKMLPEQVYFSIVVFNSTPRVWQPTMVPATSAMKQQAAEMVMSQTTGRHTASYDALSAAFALDPEAIYFLSDGAPTSGKIVNPVEIVHDITANNRIRRVSLHAIGVGIGEDNAPAIFRQFMEALAQYNWGRYKAVD